MTEHAYTIDELQQEYEKTDLHPTDRKQIVNEEDLEEETYWLLNDKLGVWTWVFWGIWIFGILFVGVIGK